MMCSIALVTQSISCTFTSLKPMLILTRKAQLGRCPQARTFSCLPCMRACEQKTSTYHVKHQRSSNNAPIWVISWRLRMRQG